VFPEKVEIWNIRGTEYYEIALDALEQEIEKTKNSDEYTEISDENFKDVPIRNFPCIDKLFKVGIRNGRYYAAVATVLMCNKCGIFKDETKKHLTTLCKTFPGITQEETDTRINNALEMHGKEYHFSCTSIKETFPEHNLCNFLQCPIKEKIEETQPDLLYKQYLNEMENLVPDDDEDNRLEQVKDFVKDSNLLKLHEDEALEIVFKTCEKFKLKKKWEDNITKRYRRLKGEAAKQNRISNAGQKDESGNDVENELIKSLATQNGKGFLACETWINNNKLNIAKIQPEILAKKLSDPRSKKYTHNDFVLGIKEKFKLSIYETDEAYHKILSINTKYHSESKRLINILKRLQTYSLKARKAAEKLLLKGKPLPFIINTWKKSHVGDESVGKTLPVCAASAFITGNNAGLPLIIIGPSGKGKSDAVNDFFDLLPPSIALRTGFSDKYLYYSNDILPGSVSFLDDKDLTGAFKELAKNLQTNFQVPVEYRTVIDGEPRVLTAPERNVLISSSVEGIELLRPEGRRF